MTDASKSEAPVISKTPEANEEPVTIEASIRTLVGKGPNRKLRASGKIPAVLCNKGKAIHLTLDPKLLSKAWKAGKTFKMALDGKITKVIITDLQLDNVKRTAKHVDLAYVK